MDKQQNQDHTQQLSVVIDKLLESKFENETQDLKSLNALINIVLPAYHKKRLNKHEIIVTLKIFNSILFLLRRCPSLILEEKISENLINTLIKFFDIKYYNNSKISSSTVDILIQISNLLITKSISYNKIVLSILSNLNSHLNDNLSYLLNSLTSSSSTSSSADFINTDNILKINDLKLSKLSTSIRIVQLLTNSKLSNNFSIQQNSFNIITQIDRLWFCLNNIIINFDLNLLNDTDTKNDSLNKEKSLKYLLSQSSIPNLKKNLDLLYSILLNSIIQFTYNDNLNNLNILDLSLSKFKFLLNWKLLNQFNSLQKMLSLGLIKICLKCLNLNNFNHFKKNIGISLDNLNFIFSKLNSNIKLNSNLHSAYSLLIFIDLKFNGNNEISIQNSDLIPSKLLPDILRVSKNKKFEFFKSKLLIDVFDNDSIYDHSQNVLKYVDFDNLHLITNNTPPFDLENILDPKNSNTKTDNKSIPREQIYDKLILELDNYYNKNQPLLQTSKLMNIYLINNLGRLACITSNGFDFKSKTCYNCDYNPNESVYLSNIIDKTRPKLIKSQIYNVVYKKILTNHMTLKNELSKDSLIKISILMALKRLFCSYRPPCLKNDTILYTYLSTCLKDHSREVRLLVSKILPLFLISNDDDDDNDNSDDQLKNDFDKVLTLADSVRLSPETSYIFEAVIMIWGELASVTELNDTLYLMLNPLVQFMGSNDEFRSNMAFHQLRLVASTKDLTPWKLIEPFIPYISIDLIKKSKNNIDFLYGFCELIKMEPVTFFTRIQKYVVPRFIHSYKDDYIGFIAKHSNKSRLELIEKNLIGILSVLLTSEEEIKESKIMKIINNATPKYKNYKLSRVVASVSPLLLIWEILCLYNSDESKKRIENALIYIARAREGNNSSGSISTTSITSDSNTSATEHLLKSKDDSNCLETLFEMNILGLAQSFAAAIYGSKGTQPFIARVQSIRGIMCLAELANSFESCLPQFMTSLQVALESPELQLEALRCLHTVIQKLRASSLCIIIDLVISYLVQKYELFSKDCREVAKLILDTIFSDRFGIISSKYYPYMLSLPLNDEFIKIRQNYKKILNNEQNNILYDLTRRCGEDNQWVVLQALDDLASYFELYLPAFHKNYVHQREFSIIIPELVSTVMNASHKFVMTNKLISDKCAKVFSFIGALDMNKFPKAKSKKRSIVLTSILTDESEFTDFTIHILNNILVKAFVASGDPQRQLFLAFVMQELLYILNLSHCDDINGLQDTSREKIIWDRFSSLSKAILKPLLKSKYGCEVVRNSKKKYPIYKIGKKYSTWLRDLTENLLLRSIDCKNIPKNAKLLNDKLVVVIRDQDLSIAEFLLPYIMLCLMVYGDEKIIADIETEIDSILQTDLTSLDTDSSIESLKFCYRCIFSVFDYFREWSVEKKKEKKTNKLEKTRVDEFLSNLAPDLLALRASQCNSYERAILYLEQSHSPKNITKDEYFSSFRQMYAELDDPDALQGVLKTFSTESLNDKLLQFQHNEDWEVTHESLSALAEYNIEDTVKNETEKLDSTTSLLKSLVDHCEYKNALSELRVVPVDISYPREWVLVGLEASIFSGQLDDLKKWVSVAEEYPSILSAGSELSIFYEFAQALITLKDNNIKSTLFHIDNSVYHLGSCLAISKEISSIKSSSYMVLLHCLYDFKALVTVDPNADFLPAVKIKNSLSNVLTINHLRFKNTAKDYRINWKIHSIKEVVERFHPDAYINENLKNSLVESCSILREAGKLEMATSCITRALLMGTLSADFELAKLLWAQGDQSRALKTLKDIIVKDSQNAEMQLTYTEWLEASANGSSTDIIAGYENAHRLDTSWGKPQYCLGRYYNKLLDAKNSEDNKDLKRPESDFHGFYELKIIKAYMRAIVFDIDYLFEVLPKVVTIWLDYIKKTEEIISLKEYNRENLMFQRKENYAAINKFVSAQATDIPAYYWYTVLSQLISRIVHGHDDTEQVILSIICNCTRAYPEVVLYSLYAQIQSVNSERVSRAEKICSTLQRDSASLLSKQVTSAFQLLEAFKGICRADLSRNKRSKLHLWDDLQFSYEKKECRALVIPLRINFQILLPSSGEHVKRNQFPAEKRVKFLKFESRVSILASMQKPRRLFIIGTDGRRYSLLCKPHDDLRKDAKLMEFTTVVNRLLKTNPESEKRQLEILSYAVVPLNESMGLIEWVPNVRTIRDIMLKYYANRGINLDIHRIKALLDEDKSLSERMNNFSKVVEWYKPVLQLWFFDQFSDPSMWYTARNNYVRSAAVMSIVGYLVGLGDRHGDNIMISETVGSVLHVDFDCLFEKGTKLAVPERVPFRLTHNLVAAFGVSGVEGPFRKTCEVVTSLIRSNESVLMNILESFLYDPIMDWRIKSKRRQQEDEKLKPQIVMNAIRRKVRGILEIGELPVSVSGQVDAVIQQATSTENLAQMYIGWMPFL
ncbi:kinase activity protein [[Candida] boidinii]|nr:kinase activity protein [[Candida] boidinii]